MPAISKRAQAQLNRFGDQAKRQRADAGENDFDYVPALSDLNSFQDDRSSGTEDDLADAFNSDVEGDSSTLSGNEDLDGVQSIYGSDEEELIGRLRQPADEDAIQYFSVFHADAPWVSARTGMIYSPCCR